MNLRTRLARVEKNAAKAGLGRPCRGCGYVPGARVTSVAILPPRVIQNISELDEPQDTSKDFCSVCGMRLIARIPSPVVARLDPTEL